MEAERDGIMKKQMKKIFSVLASVFLAVLLALPYICFREEIQQMQTVGYIGLFVACAVSNISVLMPSSSTLIVVAAASVLNPWLCVLFGGLGVALGEQTSYLCGRIGILGFGENLSERETRTVRWLRKNAFLTIFLFALIPLPVFDIVGIAAGVMRIQWYKYAIAAMLGKVLRFVLVIGALYYLLPWYIELLPPESSGILRQLVELITPA